MYSTLLILHSLVRWLVLAFIIYAVYRSYTGYIKNRIFSNTDNAVRHWTATIAHIQLMIGMLLYIKSPVVKYFWSDVKKAIQQADLTFYSIIHFMLMLLAIITLTLGSALVKRKNTDKEKFRTMLIYFSIALIIIFIAIPWPFSPLSNRPYLRTS
ncbi:hypothetical protein ACR79R_14840 [Sphingobacterium spiritivorum]|uniref:hypothetical protein n=1 Tax=Sphingobacterium spiritivorum TaxID=258 RepID=UPI003DA581D0